ncbi:MAG TPA: hypothetical protein VIU86_19910 [Gaiellaceae bacterium]
MRYWRVTFAADGTVEGVTEIDGAGAADWLVVRAETEELARRKGYNLYCAKRKKARVAQLHAEGRCACGRWQDDSQFVTCEVCRERMKRTHERRKERGGQLAPPRDETARVAAFQARTRERKTEVRLEVLLEVRRWWIEARNVGLFGARLQKEIQACMGQAVPENDSEQLAAS